MFAEPHALGFDPTMALVCGPDGQRDYDITIRSQHGEDVVYRTCGVLFDAGSDHLVGRGTRVWKAARIDPSSGKVGSETVVLKDSWVDTPREREGDILARIRRSASPKDKTALDGFLLTVLEFGDVIIAGQPDCTRVPPKNQDHPPEPQTGTKRRRAQAAKPERRHCQQVHHRIVYRELGTPLRDETSMVTVFNALADVCRGEYSMPRQA